MYYVVNSETPTFLALREIRTKIRDAKKALRKFLNENNLEAELSLPPFSSIAGGFTALKFKGEPPAGWKKSSVVKGVQFYSPKKSMTDLLKAIDELPVVDDEDVIKIVNPSTDETIFGRPGITWGDDFILLESGEINNKPLPLEGNPDVVEITYSRFLELESSIK